jgi:Ca-activated chloride channel homolog
VEPMKHTKKLLAASLLFLGAEARAETVLLDVALGKPIVLADKKQTAFLKVGLTGKELEKAHGRAPINLSIVLDRSSSMHGEKIEKAKEAALLVLDRLSSEDIVSIVTYDSEVEVLVPAMRMSEAETIRERIRSIEPRGSTALFAGVSKGIQELRKFLDKNRVNRVILMSDGQANVGPSSPNELGRLGAAASKEGISVSTIGLGLGYNEDLMVQLAQNSDGNHGFAATAEELTKIFDYELGDVLSVVAQEVTVKVRLPNEVRPLRILNRAGEIHGQEVVLQMNQLYQKQEKYVLIEVEIPAGREGTSQTVANVDVSYANMDNGETERVQGIAGVTFSKNEKDVAAKENRAVMIAAIEALAVERNKDAVALRDKGQVQQAQRVLLDNATFLEENARRYQSPRLNSYSSDNRVDADKLKNEDWNEQRKKMKKSAHEKSTQQSY